MIDAAFIVGCALLVAGASLVYVPAGVITAGGLFVLAAVVYRLGVGSE